MTLCNNKLLISYNIDHIIHNPILPMQIKSIMETWKEILIVESGQTSYYSYDRI